MLEDDLRCKQPEPALADSCCRSDLFRTPRVDGIKPIEHGHPPSIVSVALGELAASGRAVALIRAARMEVAAATGTQHAGRKRANALWDGIDGSA